MATWGVMSALYKLLLYQRKFSAHGKLSIEKATMSYFCFSNRLDCLMNALFFGLYFTMKIMMLDNTRVKLDVVKFVSMPSARTNWNYEVSLEIEWFYFFLILLIVIHFYRIFLEEIDNFFDVIVFWLRKGMSHISSCLFNLLNYELRRACLNWNSKRILFIVF